MVKSKIHSPAVEPTLVSGLQQLLCSIAVVQGGNDMRNWASKRLDDSYLRAHSVVRGGLSYGFSCRLLNCPHQRSELAASVHLHTTHLACTRFSQHASSAIFTIHTFVGLSPMYPTPNILESLSMISTEFCNQAQQYRTGPQLRNIAKRNRGLFVPPPKKNQLSSIKRK